MNPKEKILRTELVSAGAALLCCLLLCIACFLLAGLPSASLILLAAALPLSLVILPCALTWYSGRFCWAAPIFLTLGFILIPSYFLRGYFLEIGLAGLASGLFAAAVQGFHLAARREMPCTAWAAYGGLTVLYLFVSLLDLLHDALFTGGPMAGIWIAATVCCLGITLLVFRAGRRVTFYPAAWMVVLFALQFGMTYWTLPLRAVEARQDHKPMLSDLRESGAIEQDADVVMFLYRDEYYNPDSEKKNLAEVIVAKQRNGATGSVELVWLGQYTKFANKERVM